MTMLRILSAAMLAAVVTPLPVNGAERLSLKNAVKMAPVLGSVIGEEDVGKSHFLEYIDERGISWRALNIKLPNGRLMFVQCRFDICEWGTVPEDKVSQR